MNGLKKWGIPPLAGMLYAVLVILASRLLLRNLGILAGAFTDEVQILQAAGQLKNAVLVSPWLAALPIGAVVGILLRAVFRKPKVLLWVSSIAGVLMLLPLSAVALLYTDVNTISVPALLRTLLPLLT